jgi:DNA-binding beta-propeller fold protein YncE
VRVIEDNHPTFNAIAMDSDGGEVFIANSNAASNPGIFIYPVEFQPTDRIMEPRRVIAGINAGLGQTCGVAVSPEHNEIYTSEGDSGPMKVFPLNGSGDISPKRELIPPHGSGGLFLDHKNDELYITTEHVNRVGVYARTAEGEAEPLRIIQGPETGLADPHGVYVDSDTNEVLVTNHGNWRETKTGEAYRLRGGRLGRMRGTQDPDFPGVPEPLTLSTGKFLPPAITIYSRTANGDVQPLRTIQGGRTQLNLPQAIYRDPVSGEIVVANSGDDSVLFFARNASGDVAPVRVLRGEATKLKTPTGILVDAERNELWVTSWENHVANVYSRTARGNVEPVRYIRAAGPDTPPATFGRPGTVAYDPKRNEILIAN